MLNASDLYDGVVTRPYNSWSDGKLSTESARIQHGMLKNVRFPSPSPDMKTFSEAVAAFVAQLAKAGTHDSHAIAAKNARRSDLIKLCVSLGNSVSSTANGNVEALVTTGLPLRKKRQSVVLMVPSDFRIVNGKNSRELDLKVKGQKGVKTYGFEYTIDPLTDESVWVKTICSTSRCTIKGLESGKRYWFRPFVTGSKSQHIVGDAILSPYVQ